MKKHAANETSKIFPSLFVHKYMIENCKYKGGGLGKYEQRMYSFLISSIVEKNKDGLGSDQNTKQIMGPIKFRKECNMVELSDDINRDL